MKALARLVPLIFLIAACSGTKQIAGAKLKDDGKIEVTFVQVNDVYEIAPLANGKEGGMARVATLRKTYYQQNPNTFLVIAGDFLSPSVYNSLKYQGNRIRGKQMVEAMNAAGMAFAVFGNHEFDITEQELQDRINESGFKWISTNTFHKTADGTEPFKRTSVAGSEFPESYILNVTDADGTTAKIGFIGLTLPFNKASYVTYTNPLQAAKTVYNRIKDSVDAVVAITHQAIEDDEALARELPGLALIIGGHEHDMRFKKVGNIYITKAHANAKSAYVIKLEINKNGTRKVEPKLKYIDETIALDPTTDSVVQKWVNIANDNYASLGFDAKKIVLANGEALDGREAEVRSHPTNLTRLIIKSMEYAEPKADLVIMNAGSVRVDDILHPPVSQYDIIRSLPFGGGLKLIEVNGDLLKRILDAGKKNIGTGGYLVTSEKLTQTPNGEWLIDGKAIDFGKSYTLGITDFLLTGGESNLDFLNEKNPQIKMLPANQPKLASDIRLMVVKYLEDEVSRR